ANCDSTRTPANPTSPPALGAPGAAVSDAVSVVPWHCITAATVTAGWHAADCPVNSASTLRLLTRAPITAPGNPANLSAVVSGGRVTLTWSAPAGGDAAASYVIEAGSATGRVDLANFDTGSSAASLIADGVAPGIYFVRVRARNSAGTSGTSNEVVVTVTGSGSC